MATNGVEKQLASAKRQLEEKDARIRNLERDKAHVQVNEQAALRELEALRLELADTRRQADQSATDVVELFEQLEVRDSRLAVLEAAGRRLRARLNGALRDVTLLHERLQIVAPLATLLQRAGEVVTQATAPLPMNRKAPHLRGESEAKRLAEMGTVLDFESEARTGTCG